MKRHVLVVDDDELLRDLLADVFEKYCHEETIKASGLPELVLRKNEISQCEVAFIDINLGPDEPTGIDVLNWLRQLNFKGRIYFLTAHASTNPIVVQASKLGAVKILSKPVATDTLVDIVGGAP